MLQCESFHHEKLYVDCLKPHHTFLHPCLAWHCNFIKKYYLHIKKTNISCIRIQQDACTFFHKKKKKVIPPFVYNHKLTTRHTLRTWNMSRKTMDELQRGQELLRKEISPLKIQLGWVMKTLQALLRREGNLTPIAAA